MIVSVANILKLEGVSQKNIVFFIHIPLKIMCWYKKVDEFAGVSPVISQVNTEKCLRKDNFGRFITFLGLSSAFLRGAGLKGQIYHLTPADPRGGAASESYFYTDSHQRLVSGLPFVLQPVAIDPVSGEGYWSRFEDPDQVAGRPTGSERWRNYVAIS